MAVLAAERVRPKGASIGLRGISKLYGSTTALDQIDLEVGAGEFFTLLGPSGSGKTTTLMIVAGFVEPTAGAVLVDGRTITAWPPNKRGFGVVFQNYSLFPHMTVSQNIAFPLEMRRLSPAHIRNRISEMLDLVELGGMEARYPRQLSGGQQQRVALARALVFEPKALLMDEPLGALDKKLREHMQVELKRIQQRLGMTVLYVTHDQEEALTMSDHIAVMRDGRVQQVGTPDELYERPRDQFVAEFIGESNFLPATVSEVSQARVVMRLGDGARFVADSPEGARSVTAGQTVTLAIRPERLTFASDGVNVLPGTVTDVIYVGDVTRYVVRAASGDTLVVKEQNSSHRQRQRVGDAVAVTWAPADCRLLVS